MSEEREGQEELDFGKFIEDVTRETARLKRVKKEGRIGVGEEVISTVMPLIKRLAVLIQAFAEDQEEWADSVDEALEGGAGGGGDESYLLPEHHKLFHAVTKALDDILGSLLSAPDLEDKVRKNLKPAQTLVRSALELLEQLEPEEEDEDDEEEEADGEADDAED